MAVLRFSGNSRSDRLDATQAVGAVEDVHRHILALLLAQEQPERLVAVRMRRSDVHLNHAVTWWPLYGTVNLSWPGVPPHFWA